MSTTTPLLATSKKVPGQVKDRFKIEAYPQRVAMVPSFITEEDCKKNPENYGEMMSSLKHKQVERFKDGFLYPGVAFANVMYHPKHKYIVCEDGWEIPEGSELSAPIRYITVVILYDTDKDGEMVEVPEDQRRVLSDGTKVPFNYELKYANLTKKQYLSWMDKWDSDAPAINTDFKVNKESSANNAETVWSPKRECLWRKHGEALMNSILRDARPMLNNMSSKLGRKIPHDLFLEIVSGEKQNTNVSEEDKEAFEDFMPSSPESGD